MADQYEKYRLLCYQIPGVKQHTNETCWCAALEWWAKALKNARPQLNQDQIYYQYATFAVNGPNASNLIGSAKFKQLLSEAKWKADVQIKPQFGPTFLNQKLTKGPIILGYWYPTGGHVVVAVAPSITYKDEYMVMDPAIGNFTHYGYGRFSTYQDVLVAVPK